MNPVLRMIQGPGSPAAFDIGPAGFLIGRETPDTEKPPDLSLSNKLVSRRHARIWIESGCPQIENFGANGTLVNGRRIEGTVGLASGDRIQIDEWSFELEIPGAENPGLYTVIDERLHEKKSQQKAKKNFFSRPWQRLVLTACAILFLVIVLARLRPPASKNADNVAAKKTTPMNRSPSSGPSGQGSAGTALQQAKLAKRLFEERNISAENRHEALRHYDSALTLAQSVNGFASACSVWRADTLVLSQELDSLYSEHSKKAVAAFHQGKNALCREHLLSIMGLFPDPGLERHQWAKNNLLTLSQ